MKKVHRSATNKICTGLLGGIGEYFSIDPAIIRLLFVVLLVFSHVFPMVIIYITGLFIVPLPPDREVIKDAEIVQ